MASALDDIAAVVFTSDFSAARSWYSRVIGREPDIEPIPEVAEWQITATSWLQLVTDIERAGRSAVRFGVSDLAAQIEFLDDMGVATGDPVTIADMVLVLDIADPDGNEVSFVQEIVAQ